MSKYPFLDSPENMAPGNRTSNGSTKMEDAETTMSMVAQFLEQLQGKISSPQEKEVITTKLLMISKARKEARSIIGSHSQAMPLFISILRNGTQLAKVNVSATLTALCKDEELRVKVLLGGCIPPLLSLLKSESTEAKKSAAEAIYEVSSGGVSDDHVGMKIFVTEGVVPTLWEQLTSKNKQDKVVVGFVTGALRNLCGDKDGYWRVTLEAGGVDIIVKLLSSKNATIQSNVASLLARLMLTFNNSMQKIMESGAIEALLGLLSQKNDIPVRCSAADALDALSSRSVKAKEAIVDANGVVILIAAVVAPSKECMQGEGGQILQGHATRALANICGGMSSLILHLGELAKSKSTSVADVIGALAYTLMIFQPNQVIDATKIENILVALLKPQVNNLVQERILEAMASLYGNDCLAKSVNQSEAKKVLIGLITMGSQDVQEYLITSLISLCCEVVDIWEAIKKREGIQLLISFLGLSSEEHQEYAIWLLSLLTDQIDESKWAITAAGGIPPLVQLLETGSDKAREDAAYVLWNLCCHSEDICACVETAEAIPAFLWLLKTSGRKGQEASSKALRKLIRKADPAIINQLLALLYGDTPKSKAHIIEVLGHVLTMASHYELVRKGSDAYKGLRSLVQILNSSNEETQEYAASVLADLFSIRQDLCGSLATDEIVHPCMKLLTSKTQIIATQSARALGALSKNKMSYIAEGDVKPLIKLAKTSSIDAAETAVSALANLLSDSQIASEALREDVVSALTRVLGEGSLKGKKDASRALFQLLKHFPLSDVLTQSSQFQFVVLAIVGYMNDVSDVDEALQVVSLLAKTKQNVDTSYSPSFALGEVISRLQPLVCFLSEGPALVQDKVIEILSRVCGEKPEDVSELLVSDLRTIGALGNRILKSTSLEVRVGGISLLICALREHKKETMEALDKSGCLKPVVYELVDIIKQNSGCYIDVTTPRGLANRSGFHDGCEFDVVDPGVLLGVTAGMWLLSMLSSCSEENRRIVVEAGALEVLSDKLEKYTLNSQAEFEDTEGIWISALLISILFQDKNVVLSSLTIHMIPFLANLLKFDDILDKFFCAQAMASLVSNQNKKVNLTIATSGAVAGLTTLIGYIEANMSDLFAISNEFSLSRNPDQVVLENLFAIEEVKNGSTCCKTIPLLVDLLRPMPDRPGAPPFAVSLLTSIADGNDANKLIMAESGALDALTKYLSLSPQDSTESAICELLRILYTNHDLLRYKSAVYSLNQLIAVLRLGSRVTRLNAVRALDQLFNAKYLRESESALHALQPLIDMLNAVSESEQEAALLALMNLISTDTTKIGTLLDHKGNQNQNPLESLCRILSSSCTIRLKTHAATFCCVLFGNSVVRALPVACTFIEPLVLLMHSDDDSAVKSGVCAFEKLLDDEQAVSIAADYDVIDLLVGLISGSNDVLIETSISVLIKLGKDQTLKKLDMVTSGVIDNCLALLPTAPSSLCCSISELFRILTNSSAISKSGTAAKIVEPLFMVLNRPDFSLWGQHSALQALVNVLEKPQSLVNHIITPSQVIQPLISYIQSPSQTIQQLGTELLSHLLAQDHFQQDITTQNAVVPLVQLAGIGILSLQQTAIKALEIISVTWPNAVADAGGIFELAKVIIQDDPQPSHELWESAAIVLSNVLRFDSDYFFRVPLLVLVKMLNSNVESTITLALDALIVQEKSDESSAILMTEAGAIDALLDLLRSHQCEEASGRLLEALFNHVKVRAMKICKHTIGPLSQYLLDPQTRSVPGKLLAALALGDLAQHEGLARVGDSVTACRALVGLLEDQSNDEMKMVTICALQNFVMHSRTNRRAVAEAGGILIIQELLLSPNLEVAGQASLLIKFLFSNHTLQEYVSNELIRSLTAALDRELWATATINEEVLKTIHVIFSNFRKLHVSEAATLCIPHLLTALKSGNEAAQDTVLDTLCLLKRSWAVMPIETSKSQLMIASEAIPILQMLMKTCPPSFHERADTLLTCLPGSLTIMVKRATNLKRLMGGTNAFCRLKIGQAPSHQTKVVSHNVSPEWKEGFTWDFDVPPKGQKLHIQCQSKNTFGKTTLGEVTILIDKVVSDGVYSGVFSLRHGHNSSNKEGSSRTLEIEITWSNKTSDDNII